MADLAKKLSVAQIILQIVQGVLAALQSNFASKPDEESNRSPKKPSK